MLGLALRVAQSISLHESEPPFPVKPIEREMRHRLWHVIGILDIQAAFDRGSEPMLRSNCAFSEISSPSTGDLDSPFSMMQLDDAATQFLHADTRFLAIMAEAQCAFRALDVSELNAPETTPANFDTKRRQHVATTFRQKSLAHLPDPRSELITTQLDWCLQKLVNIVHAFLQLLSFRPIRSGNKNPESPPAATRRGSGLLLLTVKFLQALDQFRHDERSEPFRWFIRLFSPWHVLVVAIDEADACEDVLLRGNCQALIERFLASFQDMMTDVHRGILQGSVERLMTFGWSVPGMGNPFGDGQGVLPN